MAQKRCVLANAGIESLPLDVLCKIVNSAMAGLTVADRARGACAHPLLRAAMAEPAEALNVPNVIRDVGGGIREFPIDALASVLAPHLRTLRWISLFSVTEEVVACMSRLLAPAVHVNLDNSHAVPFHPAAMAALANLPHIASVRVPYYLRNSSEVVEKLALLLANPKFRMCGDIELDSQESMEAIDEGRLAAQPWRTLTMWFDNQPGAAFLRILQRTRSSSVTLKDLPPTETDDPLVTTSAFGAAVVSNVAVRSVKVKMLRNEESAIGDDATFVSRLAAFLRGVFSCKEGGLDYLFVCPDTFRSCHILGMSDVDGASLTESVRSSTMAFGPHLDLGLGMVEWPPGLLDAVLGFVRKRPTIRILTVNCLMHRERAPYACYLHLPEVERYSLRLPRDDFAGALQGADAPGLSYLFVQACPRCGDRHVQGAPFAGPPHDCDELTAEEDALFGRGLDGLAEAAAALRADGDAAPAPAPGTCSMARKRLGTSVHDLVGMRAAAAALLRGAPRLTQLIVHMCGDGATQLHQFALGIASVNHALETLDIVYRCRVWDLKHSRAIRKALTIRKEGRGIARVSVRVQLVRGGHSNVPVDIMNEEE